MSRPHRHRRAVFLDRDGVLNRTHLRDGVTCPPRGLNELEILPGVESATRRLAGLGLTLIVVTNQPDVARGTQTRRSVEAINAALRARLPLDDVAVCYHDAPDGCPCRKPRPGMLLSAAERHGVDLEASFMVGDRWSDVAAGDAAGCVTLLIDGPHSQAHRCRPDLVATGLPDAAERIERVLGMESSPQRARRARRAEREGEKIERLDGMNRANKTRKLLIFPDPVHHVHPVQASLSFCSPRPPRPLR
jgi:D-glycero-D-manno-heptose 1,7-bisphosphate phosphatase